MAKNLLIVESPAKAKTIEKILGPDFTVKSSFGHIRDLEKGNKGIDIQNNFEPSYVVSPEKVKVVRELKDHVKKSSEVWLATDEDREGEAISWHLCQELKLDVKTTKRIVFSEITKPAIQKAVANPRFVNVDLVNAQQARRILDRIVGFELSEVLWRKVKNKLSAGRVQSVAVKLIVEREREIQNFDAVPFFKVTAVFDVKNDRGEMTALKAEYTTRLDNEQEATDFLNKSNGASFTIHSIEKKPSKRFPAPPFTTSTLQQEASRKLGFSVNRTMSTAQRLYEEGLITYMRTDSSNLSETALTAIAQEIETSFGSKYLHTRRYKSKTANAQEAHEAIRPTYIERKNIGPDRDQMRLYELIWKRTIASQMSEAELEKTIVKINISTMAGKQLEAVGEVLKFDGFLKVYLESTDDDEDDDVKGMLPPLKINQLLDLNVMEATQSFTRPAGRYTEASLVKKLEELGIGRPSTYAPTITKIMEDERGYVTKESREGSIREYRHLVLKDRSIASKTKTEITGTTKNCLYPSDLGMVVSDFLSEHFSTIMDYGFTANVEDQLDKIATDGLDWKGMLKKFYGPFHESVGSTLENAERAKGKRELGKDPLTGYSVIAQMTRFGPVIQIGDREEVKEGEKPRFANLKPGQSMETISYDEAMELFKLPRTIGQLNNEEVTVNTGRFGPYVKYGELFVNLPRSMDPMVVTMDEVKTLIEAKLDENAPIGYYKELPITKGKGRFGPFVKWNDMFINIPVRFKLETITVEQAIELIDLKVDKEANRYIQQWPSEKISIENGRWGPYLKFGKNNLKLPKKDGQKIEDAYLQTVSLEEVKSWIEAEIPDAFKKKESPKKASTAKPDAKKK
ncbi:MAG TPA: type I DNA topoisomerase [Saprospiraceae bacterium]|jgi:DNA topoisomerase-1|nr:type I DNA topoisomerase [Saprospiraceae bacterium]HMT69293.1 type I DNA topoisomerase [Saprospiraceae bacterium]HQV66477.1 type I DNA topoisomerase [Saprospiraceae bacterium]